MRARVQKWGNSLAVRIPSAFAREAALAQDADVELQLEGGRIVITPIRDDVYSLDELLQGVTDENMHGEVDTGPSVGREWP